MLMGRKNVHPTKKTARAAVWLAIGGIFIYLAFHQVDIKNVISILQQASWKYIFLAIVSVGINLFAKAVRWHVLFGKTGKNIKFHQVLMALMNGQILNWYLPGRVGDVGRILIIGNKEAGHSYTLGTIVLEKIMDMISYTILFLYVTIFLLPLPEWLNQTGYGLTIITLLIIVVILGISARPELTLGVVKRLFPWLPKRLFGWIIQFIEDGLESFSIVHKRRETSILAFLTGLIWLSAILTNHLTGLSVNLALPITASFTVLLVVQGGTSISGIPGNIGIFQYLCILALGLFLVGHEASLSYGIILQAIVMLPTTIAGLIYNGWNGLTGSAAVASPVIRDYK